jgi:signal transduction histidine kinase
LPVGSENAVITVEVSASEGRDFLIVKITDNGKGIEKKNLERIFEPFFTTRKVGEGTGIGLSIVYGIIREHNGTIKCESDVKKGTVFTITLPAEQDARK